MTNITVYSKPDCVQCDRTYALLDREGHGYDVINLEEDVASVVKIKELGYLQAPVVVTPNGDHWSGFRPDKIMAL